MGDSMKKYREMVEDGEINSTNEAKEKTDTLQFEWNWKAQMKSLMLFLEAGDEDNRKFAREQLMELAAKLDKHNEQNKK
jgi:hypothetical protein